MLTELAKTVMMMMMMMTVATVLLLLSAYYCCFCFLHRPDWKGIVRVRLLLACRDSTFSMDPCLHYAHSARLVEMVVLVAYPCLLERVTISTTSPFCFVFVLP